MANSTCLKCNKSFKTQWRNMGDGTRRTQPYCSQCRNYKLKPRKAPAEAYKAPRIPLPADPARVAAIKAGAHCHLCPLKDSKGPVVLSSRPARALRLIIVGDNPGRTEEKTGIPFSGAGGRILERALARHKLRLTGDCYLTNTALCRGDSDRENERAAECCAPRLLRELGELPSEIPILSLGKPPTKAILGVTSILRARGFIWRSKELDKKAIKSALKKAHATEGPKGQEMLLRAETLASRSALGARVILPSVHPAFILRADTWNPIFLIDVARAARVSAGEIGAEDEGSHKVGSLKILRGLGDVVSCDIETDGIKPLETKLLCVGLSDARGVTRVVWPWKSSYAAGLAKYLHTRSKVVFHNGFGFDLLVLEAHGVNLV